MSLSNKYLYNRFLYVPSTIEGLDMCLFIVEEVCVLLNLNYEKKLTLHTIVVEAVENAFIHGNKGSREKCVKFSIFVTDNDLLIEVEDEGEGFDINSIPSPLVSKNLKKESGRGIFFIRSLSDSCCTLGKGNIMQIKISR